MRRRPLIRSIVATLFGFGVAAVIGATVAAPPALADDPCCQVALKASSSSSTPVARLENFRVVGAEQRPGSDQRDLRHARLQGHRPGPQPSAPAIRAQRWLARRRHPQPGRTHRRHQSAELRLLPAQQHQPRPAGQLHLPAVVRREDPDGAVVGVAVRWRRAGTRTRVAQAGPYQSSLVGIGVSEDAEAHPKPTPTDTPTATPSETITDTRATQLPGRRPGRSRRHSRRTSGDDGST